MRRSLTVPVLLLLCGAAIHHPATSFSIEQLSVVAEAGRNYPAGTRIGFRDSEVSFVIPAGWSGGLAEDAEVIVLGSEKLGFAMIFRTVSMTEEELAAQLAEAQPIAHDLVFEPVGVVTRKGTYLTASYRAGGLVGRALAVPGPAQQGVLYFVGGPSDEASSFEETLDQLAASTSFKSP